MYGGTSKTTIFRIAAFTTRDSSGSGVSVAQCHLAGVKILIGGRNVNRHGNAPPKDAGTAENFGGSKTEDCLWTGFQLLKYIGNGGWKNYQNQKTTDVRWGSFDMGKPND